VVERVEGGTKEDGTSEVGEAGSGSDDDPGRETVGRFDRIAPVEES
jgi:hypothetical protein